MLYELIIMEWNLFRYPHDKEQTASSHMHSFDYNQNKKINATVISGVVSTTQSQRAPSG